MSECSHWRWKFPFKMVKLEDVFVLLTNAYDGTGFQATSRNRQPSLSQSYKSFTWPLLWKAYLVNKLISEFDDIFIGTDGIFGDIIINCIWYAEPRSFKESFIKELRFSCKFLTELQKLFGISLLFVILKQVFQIREKQWNILGSF